MISLKNLDFINEFFNIQSGKNFGSNIFKTLKKAVNFDYACIYYINPKRIEYSFGKDFDGKILSEDLKIKNTKFGEIIIKGKSFTQDDKKLFKTCACIISNIIKDDEISKIIKMQVKALQEGYEQIKKADEVKTKFISHVSHELRTPLNSILGFSDILENEFIGKLNEKQKEYVNDIKISGLNLLEMINEILDMSKIESNSVTVNKSIFDTKTLVGEIENIIKPLILKKNIEFVKSVKNLEINTDRQKVMQILLNLLSNAIKFTPKNGKIELRVKNKDKNLVFSVKDNGIGIAEENQSRIFEKFEQVDADIPNSTGLGLAITKELVKILGGEISLKSEKGKGSEFTVTMNNVLHAP